MLVFIVLPIAFLTFLALASRARRRVSAMQQQYLEVTENDINWCYREVSADLEKGLLDPQEAVTRFRTGAERTVNHYVHQVHGGSERVPLDIYRQLNEKVGRLQRKLNRKEKFEVVSRSYNRRASSN